MLAPVECGAEILSAMTARFRQKLIALGKIAATVVHPHFERALLGEQYGDIVHTGAVKFPAVISVGDSSS